MIAESPGWGRARSLEHYPRYVSQSLSCSSSVCSLTDAWSSHDYAAESTTVLHTVLFLESRIVLGSCADGNASQHLIRCEKGGCVLNACSLGCNGEDGFESRPLRQCVRGASNLCLEVRHWPCSLPQPVPAASYRPANWNCLRPAHFRCQSPPSTSAVRLLLTTRSVCSDMFWTCVLAILTSAWPSSF